MNTNPKIKPNNKRCGKVKLKKKNIQLVGLKKGLHQNTQIKKLVFMRETIEPIQ